MNMVTIYNLQWTAIMKKTITGFPSKLVFQWKLLRNHWVQALL